MGTPKYKVGDEVYVLFFESVCRTEARTQYDYWKADCPTPFRGTICDLNQNGEDDMLYAVEFQEEDTEEIWRILNQNPDRDLGLHSCNQYVLKNARWILEDAMRPVFNRPEKINQPRPNMLRVLLSTPRKKTILVNKGV